jgi:hypothetical protein
MSKNILVLALLMSMSTEIWSQRIPGTSNFNTDFSIRSISFDEILSGGPQKDGIPAIDSPKYISASEADEWLSDQEPVLVLEISTGVKIFPLQILMWHEIVNDSDAIITYCPLCTTGIAFDRDLIFNGQSYLLDFGTTGRLRFSNLLMYDRQTESWWQQGSGEAVIGDLTGAELRTLPILRMDWKNAKERNPEARVLSRDTGFKRNYGINPYSGYDNESRFPFLFQGDLGDIDYSPMSRVVQIKIEKYEKIFLHEQVQRQVVLMDTIGSVPVVLFWDSEARSALDNATIAQGKQIGSVNAFLPILGTRNLNFYVDSNGRIRDRETDSIWDAFGKALEGKLQDSRLPVLVGIEHFWFSAYSFSEELDVYSQE